MLKELWNKIVSGSDYILLTMQAEARLVVYVVLGLIGLYFLLKPFVRFVMALEWNAFITYLFVILLMCLIMTRFTSANDWKYFLYAVVIFSIVLSVKRAISFIR
ncbi:hypothetical protein [Gracilibacillus salinarum]|uniref:Uncharacterized protein n=1 Tax=Gracilibacillus salinarum TaxID=2932255 RepID=A0ABY4GML9_9BACI|nr:hypothetical protein [Gracilibacillus salinarum]UOQ85425.1 hypothetical protein MUN87_00520 [Gracilibacillus salinarum]